MMLGKKRAYPSPYSTDRNIIDSKSQLNEKRARELMLTLYQQCLLTPQDNQLPLTQLKDDCSFSAYNFDSVKELDSAIQLLWTLSFALFESEIKFRHWLRDLLQPELASHLQTFQKRHRDDPFAATLTCLAFGQYEIATEEARKQKDNYLALFIIQSENQDNTDVISEKIKSLRSSENWEKMSVCHKKCWYIIAGQLGYIHEDKFVITEGLSWQCCLGIYVWYGSTRIEKSLKKYNDVINKQVVGLHELEAYRHTEQPDKTLLWYQLIQWWFGDKNMANLNTWPDDFVWLLSVYKPDGGITEIYTSRWIERLERMDLSDWAIFAALLTKSSKAKVDLLLRERDWTENRQLLDSFQLPKSFIGLARALNAHDDWDFEKEYEILVEGGLNREAKQALIFCLLPKIFDIDKSSLQASLKYVCEYPDQQDTEIETLKQTYDYICNCQYDEQKAKELVDQLEDIHNTVYKAKKIPLLTDLISCLQTKI